MTEGKVESGLRVWRCPTCGQQDRVDRGGKSIPVTPTADVRELVEALRWSVDWIAYVKEAPMRDQERERWEKWQAACDLAAKYPSCGEGEE